ncbi:hypothetical protein DI137_00470 [Legionella pneumophila]|nr:hypothetical protein DI137_00470 [Legionella pneumophila]
MYCIRYYLTRENGLITNLPKDIINIISISSYIDMVNDKQSTKQVMLDKITVFRIMAVSVLTRLMINPNNSVLVEALLRARKIA